MLLLCYLGAPEVALDGEARSFATSHAAALLFYLGAEPRRQHSRSALAGLLWPDSPEPAARQNLRQTLVRLRASLREGEGTHPYLLATRTAIRLAPDAPLRSDLTSFSAHLTTWRAHGHDRDELCTVCYARLREAAALYRGPFLDGFTIASDLFEEWVALRRQALEQEFLDVLATLAAHLERQGDWTRALAYIRRQLQLEPWRETAHVQAMRLLAASGQRSAALAQFETCRRLLESELNVEPAPGTIALYQRIRDNYDAGQNLASSPPAAGGNLPLPLTSFVGREKELELLAGTLLQPDRRLITLSGPGGIGKSRLALQVARQQRRHFRDGVWWVSLAEVETQEGLLLALADTLGLTLNDAGQPLAQLVAGLEEKEILIVLDNFEHLAESGTDTVLALLRGAPFLRILVTSRDRLNAQAESVLSLQGLPYPRAPHDEGALGYAAVSLFADRAARASLGWSPARETVPAILRLCRLLEGMPLALELAAAAIEMHTEAEIVAAIEHDIRFLNSKLRDLPARHRSVQAAFAYSWRRLGTEAQVIFARLSCFPGAFDATAARIVAGATPAFLSELESRSLLSGNGEGRYRLHAVLRQLARKELADLGGEKERAHENHARYFTSFLSEREAPLQAGAQKEAVADIRRELDNVRAAWRWNAAHRPEQLALCLKALFHFYDQSSRFREGEGAFRYAAERVSGDSLFAERGRLLTRQGIFARRLGHFTEAEALLEEGVALARRARDPHEWAFSLSHLGHLRYMQGSRDEAHALLRRSLEIAHETGDPWLIATALHSLALALGTGAHTSTGHREAITLYSRAIELRRRIGDHHGLILSLNGMGIAHEMLGELKEAKALYEESLALSQEQEDRWASRLIISNLGDVALALGEYENAWHCYREALREEQAIGTLPHLLLDIVKIANLIAEQGHPRRAVRLLALPLRHPSSDTATHEQANRLLDRIRASRPTLAVETIVDSEARRSVKSVVAELLAS